MLVCVCVYVCVCVCVCVCVRVHACVTRFGKTCIVHTSDFDHLEIYKNHREWYTDLKLLGMIKE